MNDTPKQSERVAASLGTAIFGAPVSFLVWLIINLLLRASGGIDMFWVASGIVLFAILGFVFPRSFGQKFRYPTPDKMKATNTKSKCKCTQ